VAGLKDQKKKENPSATEESPSSLEDSTSERLHSAKRPRRLGKGAPYIILIALLAITYFISSAFSTHAHEKNHERFVVSVERAKNNIESHFKSYADLIGTTAGLFAVKNNDVSRADFHAFAVGLGLEQKFPEIQALGFVKSSTAEQRDSLLQTVRATGFPSFTIFPSSGFSESDPIIYAEPANLPNDHSIGYDLFTDSASRDAMIRARDSGFVVVSQKIVFPQEIDPERQNGLLLYNPVYRSGAIPSLLEERRRQHIGYTYTALRSGNLFTTLMRKSGANVAVAIFDTTTFDSTHLVYDSRLKEGYDPYDTIQTKLAFGGSTFNAIFATTPEFEDLAYKNYSPIVFIAGLLISLLFFLLVRAQVRAYENTVELISLEEESEQLRKTHRELQKSHAIIIASETQLRLIIESILDYAIIFTDLKGRILLWNPGVERVLGYKDEEFVDKPVHILYTEQDIASGQPERELKTAETKGFAIDERWHRKKDGELFWSSGIVRPVIDERGKPQGFLKVMQDLTQRKLMEDQLARAKNDADRARAEAERANFAKDQFLAMLSHELRTPLTPILATVEALQEDPDVPEDLRPYFELIQRNASMQAQLVDDLLDVTRIAKGKIQLKIETFDTHKTMSDVVGILKTDIEKRRLNIVQDYHAKEHFIKADCTRFNQIVWNLLRNAIKFTSEEGTITIKTYNESSKQLVIEVSDTGIGIEPDVLPKLFRAFEQGREFITQKFGGLGLGLTITKGLVQLFEGSITVFSEGIGKGSTFRIEFPTAPTPAQSAPEPVKPQPITSAKGKGSILLVDDQADLRASLKVLLERRGYEVTSVGTADEAINAIKEKDYDLMISDIGLGDKSGLDLIQEANQIRPTIKSIALSGYGTPQDIYKSKQAGFVHHLIKPFHFPYLYELVEKLMKEKREELV